MAHPTTYGTSGSPSAWTKNLSSRPNYHNIQDVIEADDTIVFTPTGRLQNKTGLAVGTLIKQR